MPRSKNESPSDGEANRPRAFWNTESTYGVVSSHHKRARHDAAENVQFRARRGERVVGMGRETVRSVTSARGEGAMG